MASVRFTAVKVTLPVFATLIVYVIVDGNADTEDALGTLLIASDGPPVMVVFVVDGPDVVVAPLGWVAATVAVFCTPLHTCAVVNVSLT